MSVSKISKTIHFKPMPNYELMMRIVRPTIIDEINSRGYYHYFDYNPYSVKTLLDQKSFSSLKTQLRFCYLTYDQTVVKDCGPEYLSISLNGRSVYSFAEELDNQISEPIDITDNCLLNTKNVLHIWMNRSDIVWSIPCAFEISLVKSHCSQSIFTKIKNDLSNHLSINHTKAMIKKRLGVESQPTGDDIEILNESIRCSLLCPITGSRIEIACRSSVCDHIQCFDLFSFLKMSDSKYDWLCPICNKPAMPHLLRIDKFFNDILSKTDQSSDEFLINSDNSWIAYKRSSEYENTLDKTINLDDSYVESIN